MFADGNGTNLQIHRKGPLARLLLRICIHTYIYIYIQLYPYVDIGTLVPATMLLLHGRPQFWGTSPTLRSVAGKADWRWPELGPSQRPFGRPFYQYSNCELFADLGPYHNNSTLRVEGWCGCLTLRRPKVSYRQHFWKPLNNMNHMQGL